MTAPLTPAQRAALITAISPFVAQLAEDLRDRLVTPTTAGEAAARAAAERLQAEEGNGEAFDVWLDLLARRAAVSWALRLVYARVLEDRRLIRPRLADRAHQELFERLAPSLGDTAFVRWVFRDLGAPDGGLPELFAAPPIELLPPADAPTRALVTKLRERDEAGRLRHDFAGERFDGQLLGDLYQELDPVVKERFALLQTPPFVRAFILDRTLGEALKLWPADEVRVIDPACGSGHFLIDALRRLVAATAAQHPDWRADRVVAHALQRVVGVDLNDTAAALARARLVMTALELSGHDDLAHAATFHPHVYAADGLEQIERDGTPLGTQGQFGDDLAAAPRSTLTPGETRARLKPVLEGGFHVVVANPPFITEKDDRRKAYHKEKTGRPKAPRYVSATGKYSLGAVFIERCFQLAKPDGFVGMINTNAFAKREFGHAVVEQVLASNDLTLLVDTSGAFIPGHGTPTLMLFARHRKPQESSFQAVLGKRGEPSEPNDASQGRVWSAIVAGWNTPGFDSPFVSTEPVDRAVFAKHPWSLRGGGALALQEHLAKVGDLIQNHPYILGVVGMSNADDCFVAPPEFAPRSGIEGGIFRPLVTGEQIRDWGISRCDLSVFPYDSLLTLVDIHQRPRLHQYLWRVRETLFARATFDGGTYKSAGRPWWEWHQVTRSRLATPLTVTFAEVATHNHFVLDRGGKVFKQTAPVIKLPADATEDDHLALLGPLNSSAGCFWLKQVCFDKGNRGEGGGITSDTWERFYQYDSTKVSRFPLPPAREACLPWARALDALGHARAADTVAATLTEPAWQTPEALRAALDARRARDLERLLRMVALQEELDWLVYRLYGLVPPELPVAAPEATAPLRPGHRPFELTLAARDAEVRALLALGEVPDDTPTAWFERHGWAPALALPADVDPATAARVAARLALTASAEPVGKALRLLEAPVHKRRWYLPDFAADETEGLRLWLLDRIEAALQRADAPETPKALARGLMTEPRFVAAAVAYTGSAAPDPGALVAALMADEAVAAHPVHRYTAKGLVKREAWEETWRLQAAEDRHEPVGKIKVPPSYTGADFVGGVAYPLRGKLDVPKERFVAHTEVPTADGRRRVGQEALYGWAGWTRPERLARLFALLERLESEGVPSEELTATYDLMFRYADDLARTDPAGGADQRADLRAEAGSAPTKAQLQGWLKTHPASGAWGGQR